MINVYWIKDGKEHEGKVRKEKFNDWLEWAKQNTFAYGWEELKK